MPFYMMPVSAGLWHVPPPADVLHLQGESHFRARLSGSALPSCGGWVGRSPTNPRIKSMPHWSRSSTLARVVCGSGEVLSVALKFRWVKQIHPFSSMVSFRHGFPLFSLYHTWSPLNCLKSSFSMYVNWKCPLITRQPATLQF